MSDTAPRPGSKYVALGSSFAAGPGGTPVVDKNALRSSRNYAHQVAQTLRLELVDGTCSGATTANILTTPQRKRPAQIGSPGLRAGDHHRRRQRPRLRRHPAHDGTLGTVVRRLPLLPAPWRERLGNLVAFRTTPTSAPNAFASVAASQAEVIDRVRKRAPHARILLIDHLTLVPTPPPAAHTISLTHTQIRDAADVGKGLAEAFRSASARSGAELVIDTLHRPSAPADP